MMYYRWYQLAPEVLAERFWAKVDKRSDEECWPWTGGSTPRGYGKLVQIGAHRISIYLATGVMPGPDEFACHHCDNPPCVNPAHLFVGSHMDNVRDRVAKHRGPCCAKGHPYDEANTLWTRQGWRQCRTCKNARNREFMRGYSARKRAEREAS